MRGSIGIYTDDEEQIFDSCRPVILNGITGIATRADLLERCLALKLPPMSVKQRATEAELRGQFEQLRPQIMGELFDIVSCAIRWFDKVMPPKTIRMADAAQWLQAAEPATGLPEGTLIAALEASQADLVQELMDGNSLAIALTKVVEKEPFEGTLGDLYEKLEAHRPQRDRYFPNSSSQLSKAFARDQKALATVGILVEIGNKTRKGRMVKVHLEEGKNFDDALSDTGGYPGIPL